MQYLFIFIGGAFGALMRYLFSFFNHGHDIPIGTLSANLIGGFFMGFLSALTIKLFNNNPLLKKAVTTGFMGALTTFSTFQFELVQMFKHLNEFELKCRKSSQCSHESSSDSFF